MERGKKEEFGGPGAKDCGSEADKKAHGETA